MLPPNASLVTAVAVIRTTAGLTFAAALTTEDESSTSMGLELGSTTAALDPVGERLRAPVPWRTSTVPPEARTAERNAAAAIAPMPLPPVVDRTAGTCEGAPATPSGSA